MYSSKVAVKGWSPKTSRYISKDLSRQIFTATLCNPRWANATENIGEI